MFVWDAYIDKNRATLNRAIIAIGVGWALIIVSLFVITGVDYFLAESAFKSERIIGGLADRFMFAAMLGWAFPALVVFFAWLFHMGLNKIRRRWFPHLVFKR